MGKPKNFYRICELNDSSALFVKSNKETLQVEFYINNNDVFAKSIHGEAKVCGFIPKSKPVSDFSSNNIPDVFEHKYDTMEALAECEYILERGDTVLKPKPLSEYEKEDMIALSEWK